MATLTQNELINSGLQVKLPLFYNNHPLFLFSERGGWLLVQNLIIPLFVNRKVPFEEHGCGIDAQGWKN